MTEFCLLQGYLLPDMYAFFVNFTTARESKRARDLNDRDQVECNENLMRFQLVNLFDNEKQLVVKGGGGGGQEEGGGGRGYTADQNI